MKVVDDASIVRRDGRVAGAVRAAAVDLDCQMIAREATGKGVELLVAPISNGADVPGDYDYPVRHDDALPCKYYASMSHHPTTGASVRHESFGPRPSGPGYISVVETIEQLF